MILFPAIDLKEGLAVRLEQGDMARATVFNRDPAAQAHAFETQGFEYLHIVDLDGAFAGKPVNGAAVERILEDRSAMPVQLGGGIRDMATIEGWLGKGVNRVIIGTAAVRDPELVKDGGAAISRTRRGRARRARRQGRGRGLGGDLGADGARHRASASRTPASPRSSTPTSRATACCKGLNLDATIALAEAVSIPVIASGGLASIEDVKALLEPRAQQARRRDRRPRALRRPARSGARR